MQVRAELFSGQAEMLAQEPQLFSSEAGGAVDERLRDRAVDLREARDSDLRAPALSAPGDFNAAENYVGKATFGVSIVAALRRSDAGAAIRALVSCRRSLHGFLLKTVMKTAWTERQVNTTAIRMLSTVRFLAEFVA
jgi:hypothetical protein